MSQSIGEALLRLDRPGDLWSFLDCLAPPPAGQPPVGSPKATGTIGRNHGSAHRSSPDTTFHASV